MNKGNILYGGNDVRGTVLDDDADEVTEDMRKCS